MKLKPGYKMTEVGVIPEDWEVKTVEDFGEIVTGGTPSTQKKEFWGGEYPWITPTDISLIRDMNTSKRTITYEGLNSIRFLPANTVLVTCIASIGKNAVLRSVGGCNQQINAIIPNDDYCADFLYFLMETSKQYLLSNAGTTATAILSKATFSKLKFVVPRKSEQRAIAQALSDVDALLSALDQMIDKKRNLKQAAMQQLLTGKTRLPGFSGEWVVKRLKDLAHLSKTGINPSSTPESLFTHFSLPAFDANETPVIESGASIGSNKFVVPPGAVLLSKLNPRIPRVWAPNCIPSNSVCSTEFLVLIPNEGVDRNFFKYLCASTTVASQMELHAIGTTGSHQRIHPTQVMAIEVKTPTDDDERSAISSVLRDIDAELSNLNRRRDKTVELKQAMMQELLTGKTRLVQGGLNG